MTLKSGLHFCGNCGVGFESEEHIEFHMDNLNDLCAPIRALSGLPPIEQVGDAGFRFGGFTPLGEEMDNNDL